MNLFELDCLNDFRLDQLVMRYVDDHPFIPFLPLRRIAVTNAMAMPLQNSTSTASTKNDEKLNQLVEVVEALMLTASAALATDASTCDVGAESSVTTLFD